MKQFWGIVPAAIAAGISLGMSPNKAMAQTIRYEVKVQGYSDAGWIEVRTGRGGGGKVVKDKTGTWTDRVKRDEPLRVTITDSRAHQCEMKEAIVGVVADNGFVRGKIVNLPFQAEFVVSGDPTFDNVTVVVINKSNGKVVTRRVPIGTR